jgi:hypothetical protein
MGENNDDKVMIRILEIYILATTSSGTNDSIIGALYQYTSADSIGSEKSDLLIPKSPTTDTRRLRASREMQTFRR